MVTSGSGVQSPNDLSMMADVSLEATRETTHLSYSSLKSSSLVTEALASSLKNFSQLNDGSVSSDLAISSSECKI